MPERKPLARCTCRKLQHLLKQIHMVSCQTSGSSHFVASWRVKSIMVCSQNQSILNVDMQSQEKSLKSIPKERKCQHAYLFDWLLAWFPPQNCHNAVPVERDPKHASRPPSVRPVPPCFAGKWSSFTLLCLASQERHNDIGFKNSAGDIKMFFQTCQWLSTQ